MQRREFITLVCGVAVAWPRAGRAQQPARRIGVLMNGAPDDAEVRARLAAFLDGLQQLGWTDGRNVRIDTRWASDVGANRGAEELVALGPDVILASASLSVSALQRITRVCRSCSRMSSTRLVPDSSASLARPGGNTTGFSAFEYSLSGKWLDLLKEIAPSVARVAVLCDPALAAGIGQFAAIEALAPASLVGELIPIDVRDPGEIERAIGAFARERNGGLIVTGSQSQCTLRNLIVSLATRYRLPNVHAYRYYAAAGGLASYGPDPIDAHKRAAGYVDRILKGEKPADLPVQAPTRYALVITRDR